jgi:serine/threonine protein kinase
MLVKLFNRLHAFLLKTMHSPHLIRLSSYEKLKTLGTGPVGRTYQLRDKQSSVLFACKSVIQSPPESPELIESLERLIAISHPCLLPIIGFSLPGPNRPLAFVTPYLPNGSLQNLLSSESLSDELKTKILFGVAEGLRFLHSMGLSHDSITTENILLTSDRDPVISHFGLSFARADKTADAVAYATLASAVLGPHIPSAFQFIFAPRGSAPFSAIVLHFLTTGLVSALETYASRVLHPSFTAHALAMIFEELDSAEALQTSLSATLSSLASQVHGLSPPVQLEQIPEEAPQQYPSFGGPRPMLARPTDIGRRTSAAQVRPLVPEIQPVALVDILSGRRSSLQTEQRIVAVEPPVVGSFGSASIASKSFPFESDPFDGIFAFLTREARGNPVLAGIVSMTSSPGDPAHSGDLPRLLDKDWRGCWISQNRPESWIVIDFCSRPIVITHYSLKTYHCAVGYSHLCNWDLEGYREDQWIPMDSQRNNNDLNGRSKVHTFELQQPGTCTAIKIIQKGANHHGDHYLILRGIEIFGELIY